MRGVRGMRVGALAVAVGLLAAACGGGNDNNSGASSGGGGDQAEAKKVGVVYDIGGRGDKSFNDSAYAGLQAAEKEQGDKIQAKDIEPNPDGSNRKELLDGLADEGYGLIFGIGFLFS
jgi:basic membrane protein A and related proteins